MLRLIVLLLLSAAVAACQPTQLGQCVEADVTDLVVYDSSGNPAYAGQAMLQQSCQACHSRLATKLARRGAPADLDFDMVGSRTADPSMPDQDAIDDLLASRQVIFEWRFEMFDTVEDGEMPPAQAGVEAFLAAGYRYPDGRPLEAIESADGREIYREWLVCNGPVVDRTGDEGTSCPSTDLPPGHACLPRVEAEPIPPVWSAIYDQIFVAQCVGCHGDGVLDIREESALDMSDATTAYEQLTDGSLRGEDCAGAADRIVAGNADASMLIHKLEGEDDSGAPVCGDLMPSGVPLTSLQIDAIRTWIDNGAMMD